MSPGNPECSPTEIESITTREVLVSAQVEKWRVLPAVRAYFDQVFQAYEADPGSHFSRSSECSGPLHLTPIDKAEIERRALLFAAQYVLHRNGGDLSPAERVGTLNHVSEATVLGLINHSHFVSVLLSQYADRT
jgi:hypothetical protein